MESQLLRRLACELRDKENWIKTAQESKEKAKSDYEKALWEGTIIEAESTVRSYKNILDIYSENEKTAV
ncbi:hypothetical protein [Sporolactobacillus laevolacticus]|uniref:Uncharacterized protein n=1 Tax=Sporolactobacillus laevolacticus DSM 442 TaxID=1395513 RepID=V6IVR7_9BACL|nr:hypothetical protein [Sporolactobacillus laevolacticus]EST11277.1 hypothetical protein P343_12805 [Sporolactobacillus laevolacticus DSM 442]